MLLHLCCPSAIKAGWVQRLSGLMGITTGTDKLLFSSAPLECQENPTAEAAFLRVSAGGTGRQEHAPQAAERGELGGPVGVPGSSEGSSPVGAH